MLCSTLASVTTLLRVDYCGGDNVLSLWSSGQMTACGKVLLVRDYGRADTSKAGLKGWCTPLSSLAVTIGVCRAVLMLVPATCLPNASLNGSIAVRITGTKKITALPE